VVQEIPTESAIRPKLVPDQVAAQHHTHQLACIAPTLRCSKHDIARNIIGVVDELLTKHATLVVIEFEVQILDSPRDYGTEQAQGSGRGDENVPPLCRSLLVADYPDALI